MCDGEMFKRCVVVLPIKIIRQGDGKILTRPGGLVYDHDPLRIRVRERTKQDCVDYAEDCRVRADPECERGDCDRGKGGVFDKLPESKANLVHKLLPEVRHSY